jgi:hypothetical protein
MDDVRAVVMLSAVIWLAGYLLPKTLRERDPFGIFCAGLAFAFALLMLLLDGIRTR